MMSSNYTRHQFLRQLGLGGAALLAVYCGTTLSSCQNSSLDPQTPASGSVDFTLDLTATAYAALKKNGGYVVTNNIVVARTMTGEYAAVTVVCSHEGNRQVTFTTSNEFYCTAHGARFDVTGKGLNSDGRKGLTVYKTALTDATKLRVYA